MRVVYQAYGGGDYREQARFSALSLAHHDAAQRCRVALYTDRPDAFAGLGWDLVPLDAARIAAWRGRFDFVHRLKLAALRDAVDRFADADGWMVLDADTQWRDDPAPLADALRAGRAVMHVPEGRCGPAFHGVIHRALVRHLPEHVGFEMLNAGVIGVPAQGAAAALDEAIALTDRLLLRCLARNWLEQAAVSIVLPRRYAMDFAGARILHYWNMNKEIGPALARFFAEHAPLSGPALAAAAAAFDPVPETLALQARLRAQPRTLRSEWARLKRSWGKRRIDLRVLAARIFND